jgi:chromosome partitioning protein
MTPLVIAVANLKGGTGKTTTAGYLAHAFQHELKRSVIIVDGDPQESMLDWSELSDWSIPTVALPSKQLHRRLPGVVGKSFDVVIIDTPPFSPQSREEVEKPPPGIVHSALKVADVVVIPLAPTMAELRRAAPTLRAIRDAARAGQNVVFLLNRVVHNAGSTKAVRDVLMAQGSTVLQAQIPRLEPLAQSLGAPITGPLHGYLSAALELENLK